MTIYGLTKKQSEIFQYIRCFISECGYSPSLEEIQVHFKLKSKSNVHAYLVRIKERGLIKIMPNRARSIQLIAPPIGNGNSIQVSSVLYLKLEKEAQKLNLSVGDYTNELLAGCMEFGE